MGEQTGTLPIMLNRIALTKEKNQLLKNKMIQALLYPTLILLVAIVVSITMLLFVIPRFENLFLNMQNTLPAFTRLVISFSKFFRAEMWLTALPLICFLIVLYLFKTSLSFRHKIDHISLKLPWISRIYIKIILARLTRGLAIAYAAGIPITEALKVIANIGGNQDFLKAMTIIQTRVTAGQQLHAAMQSHSLFPILTIQMVKVGEESGALDYMLEKIAELYESDLNNFVANLEQILEPLIMIILGVLIGGMVIAMYLPIFKLGTVI